MLKISMQTLRVIVAVGLVGAATGRSALAQQDGEDPYAFQHPGVPDRNGCVKLCLRDDSPCDPEYFKHADGRCTNNTDNRH